MEPADLSVSVVMPVHNALPYLDAAVESILGQTWRDFEFVIFDDGSTDGSTERLREWASRDRRIKLFASASNLGPVASSRRVVELATGDLIARMDADDVCHPERIARQVEIMRLRPDVSLVATACDVIDPEGRRIRGPDLWRLKRRSWFAPFAHGSVMFHRRLYDAVGGYRRGCELWEDQDLFVRMLAHPGARIVSLPDALYSNRHSHISTRLTSTQARIERAVDLMYRSVDRLSEGRWYDDLLNRPEERERLDPRVFISVGSLELWANGHPRLFRHFLAASRVRSLFLWTSAFVWTFWASVSPSTLRGFMKALGNLRNWLFSGTRETGLIEWRPPRALQPQPTLDAERAECTRAGKVAS